MTQNPIIALPWQWGGMTSLACYTGGCVQLGVFLFVTVSGLALGPTQFPSQ